MPGAAIAALGRFDRLRAAERFGGRVLGFWSGTVVGHGLLPRRASGRVVLVFGFVRLVPPMAIVDRWRHGDV